MLAYHGFIAGPLWLVHGDARETANTGGHRGSKKREEWWAGKKRWHALRNSSSCDP